MLGVSSDMMADEARPASATLSKTAIAVVAGAGMGRKRNLAIAGALVAFILLVFTVTILNLKRNIDARKEALAAGAPVEYAR